MTIEALDVVRLIGGLVYLVLGGDMLVRGALGLARRTSIPPLIIGLTVVALGTSAPELVISVYAAVSGLTDVALGNVVGSNIANILLVLGAPALISPIVANATGLRRQTAFMLAVTVLFVGLSLDGTLSSDEGLLLLGVLVAALFSAYFFGIEVAGADEVDDAEQLERVLGLPHKLFTAIGFVVAGIVMLPIGADLTVEGAVSIARSLSIPDVVIASTIVALGTSLPELSTTIIAAFHRSSDIAIGNVVGSNVLNVLLVAGASAMLAPLPVAASLIRLDFQVQVGVALLLLVFVLTRLPIGRAAGVAMLAGYVGYVAVVL
ncbi:MAG: sodium:calcium antiporter [Woeseia sp.]|nr:sodium:calcium antiporter [Woeseia sp.]NNE60513.1 sodium:calcium antiporter [Woeseia sp.]NNL54975.1 sodium:calcium antiporter [Woeseia sp.]